MDKEWALIRPGKISRSYQQNKNGIKMGNNEARKCFLDQSHKVTGKNKMGNNEARKCFLVQSHKVTGKNKMGNN